MLASLLWAKFKVIMVTVRFCPYKLRSLNRAPRRTHTHRGKCATNPVLCDTINFSFLFITWCWYLFFFFKRAMWPSWHSKKTHNLKMLFLHFQFSIKNFYSFFVFNKKKKARLNISPLADAAACATVTIDDLSFIRRATRCVRVWQSKNILVLLFSQLCIYRTFLKCIGASPTAKRKTIYMCGKERDRKKLYI